MKEKFRLTNQVLTFHNGERKVVMAEGQLETPQVPPVNTAKSEAPKAAEASVEKDQIVHIGEALKNLVKTPEFQRQTQEKAEEAPEQEAVKRRREEAEGVKTYAQLPTIDTTGVTDPWLRSIMERYNRRLGIGMVDVDELNNIVNQLEERLRDPALIGIDRIRAEEVRNQLEAEMAAHEQERREAMRERERYGTLYGERRLTADERRIIQIGTNEEVDQFFNRMFVRVDSRPKDEWRDAFGTAGEIELNEFITALNEASTDQTLTGTQRRIAAIRIQQYSNEKKLRETVHTANYAVLAGIGTEQLVGFVQSFQSELADLAFSKKAVVQAMHFHEQALLKVREENGGYLPYEEVVGDPIRGQMGRVEQLAREYLNQALNFGLIPGTELRDAAGNIIGYGMEEWEINRAIAFARGMGIITGRTIEIAASSKLPEEVVGGQVGGRFASLYAQDIIRDIAPFRHLILKFNIGKERNHVLAFLLNRGRSPWSQKELREWDWDARIDVINGLVGDKEERFLGVLNPFRVGGILSRTSWRYGDRDDPTASAIGDFLRADPDNRNWIGTGVWIEKLRGNIPHNEQEVREQLRKIARTQPLKIFFNIKNVQENVLRNLGLNMQDQQLREDLDMLVLLQEKTVQDRANALDFNLVQDATQRQRTERIANIIRQQFVDDQGQDMGPMNKFVEDLRDREWRLPFNFGTDDLPWDKYNFGKTGGTSIARRWRDIGSEKKAVDGLLKLVTGMDTFKKAEDMIPVLREIYNGVAGYDEDLARESMPKLSEGIMKFYGKDWISRLPFGIGTAVGFITGKASYAQFAFGKGAMAWDETDTNEFTRLVRDTGMLTLEQQHKLQEKAGGGKKEVAYGLARTIIPLITLALIYYLLTKTIEEK